MTSTTGPTERVGRYQLLEPIGIGPSGAVSRAKVFGVAGFERQFAIKRFHSELTATAAMAAMLSAAARAYGSLEHPRIARMSEFGVAQGATFTAVEYVLGLDALRLMSEAKLAGATLAAGGALALVSQAARAVGYAHGRGLTHLGLAPTNVLVTADGDIKITDFGILSATLPQRPIEMARLAQRIPYLAPEQLANEAPSAATDVFALGVLAYELVTGQRTFKGDTPQAVAAAIMAGPPPEPPLPRPIVRVLSRCLARSPFERFPDARALADALDAALRVAPVPGTRKDIGAQVKETLDRLAALNEGQMSGVVALNIGTGPIRRIDDPAAARQRAATPGRGSEAARAPGGPATVAGGPVTVGGPLSSSSGPPTVGGPLSSSSAGSSGPPTVGGPLSSSSSAGSSGPPTVGGPLSSSSGFSGSSGPATVGGPLSSSSSAGSSGPATVGGPLSSSSSNGPPTVSGPLSFSGAATVGGPAATLQDLPRQPMTTVPGLAPPPIPVPTGVGAPATPPPPPAQPGGSTLLGVGKSPPPAGIPSIKTRPGSVSGIPSAKPPSVPGGPLRPPTRPGTDLGIPLEPAAASDGPIRNPDSIEVETIDSGVVNVVELDALADDASFEGSGAADAPTITSPRSDHPPGRGEGDTKSAAPATLEPSLFDPIVPRSDPAVKAAPGGDATDDDHGFDDDDEHRAPTNSEPTSNAPTSSPAGSGQTILGFAAPLAQPRPVTPSPHGQNSAASPSSDDEPAPNATTRMRPDNVRSSGRPSSSPASPGAPAWQRDGAEAQPAEHRSSSEAPAPPQRPIPPGWMAAPPPSSTAPETAIVRRPRPDRPRRERSGEERPRRRALWIVLGILGTAVAGVGAWQIYVRVTASPTTSGNNTKITKAPSDAQIADAPGDAAKIAVAPPTDAAKIAVAPPTDAVQVAVAPPTDAAQVAVAPPADATKVAVAPPTDAAQVAVAPPADAARVAIATPDAGTPPSDARGAPSDARGAPADAAQVAVKPTVPPVSTGTGDTLSIASIPPGARVFLDGSDTGATPVKLPGSPDRHTIALLLAGHELYVAQVDGHGTFQIPLKEITPTNGPAGIKVLRCKAKDRYYVFIDGKPTGQTCPTERIGCEVGPHTVEVYDVVSETRRKWDIVVKDTRLSFRVRVE